MIVKEASWIGNTLLELLAERGELRLLNIGSSTGTFRSVDQPYIDALIFQPLSQVATVSVWHCDARDGHGIDVELDVTSEGALGVLSALDCNTFLVSNLLEHVGRIEDVVSLLDQLVPAGRTLIVTGPKLFPYHPDPIDNMFRPSRLELERLFPSFEIQEFRVVKSPNVMCATTTGLWQHVRSHLAFFRQRLAVSNSERPPLERLLPVSAFCCILERKGPSAQG